MIILVKALSGRRPRDDVQPALVWLTVYGGLALIPAALLIAADRWAIFWLIVLQVRADGAIPVNLVVTRATIIACGTVEAAFDRLFGAPSQPTFHLLYHLTHHSPRCRAFSGLR
jgi:hypothetical protein